MFLIVGALTLLALFIFSRTHSIAIAVCMMALMGIISAAVMIFVRSFLQLHPPAELRGRVFGWYASFTSPLMALSLVIAVPLASAFSAATILMGASLAELATALVATAMLVRIQRHAA